MKGPWMQLKNYSEEMIIDQPKSRNRNVMGVTEEKIHSAKEKYRQG